MLISEEVISSPASVVPGYVTKHALQGVLVHPNFSLLWTVFEGPLGTGLTPSSALLQAGVVLTAC